MPAIAWFTVSRQVLTDQLTGWVSAINLLDLVVAEPHQMPADASAEYREQFEGIHHMLTSVVACAQWVAQPDDSGRKLEARLVIVAPDGRETPVEQSLTKFSFETPLHKTVMLLPPIGLRKAGPHRFRAQCRVVGGSWEDQMEYQFLVFFPEQIEQMEREAKERQQATELADESESNPQSSTSDTHVERTVSVV